MELREESQKVAYENIKEVLLAVQKDSPDITDEIVEKLLNCFKEVLSIGDTSFIALFATMCVESLDYVQYLDFIKGYKDRNHDIFINNSIVYSTMNTIDLK